MLIVCWIVVIFLIGCVIICWNFLGNCGTLSSINSIVSSNKKIDDMVLDNCVNKLVSNVIVVFGSM